MITAADVQKALVDQGRGPAAIWGSADTAIEQVIVCWSASAATMSAAEHRSTVFVCRAHPFFASPAYFDPAEIMDEQGWLERSVGDPVIAAKAAMLEGGTSAILWAPRLWDVDGPATRSQAFAEAGGFAIERPDPDIGAVTAELPSTSFGELLSRALPQWEVSRAFVMGNMKDHVTRVGFVAGVASPAELQSLMLDPSIGGAFVGEVVEWEGAPFVVDAAALGRPFALAAVGAAASEQFAGAAVADRLRELVPGADVRCEFLREASWPIDQSADSSGRR